MYRFVLSERLERAEEWQILDRLEQFGFDCLITCDKNMQWQQSLRTRQVSVVILPFQKLSDLQSLAEEIAYTVKSIGPGEIGLVEFRSR